MKGKELLIIHLTDGLTFRNKIQAGAWIKGELSLYGSSLHTSAWQQDLRLGRPLHPSLSVEE